MGDKASKDEKSQPSLELPSLKVPGLRRRKGSKTAEPPTQPPAEPPPPRTVETEPRARTEPAEPRRSRPSLPALPGPLVAGLTGLVVGGVAAGATYGALTGCEAVRGTSTCGGAPGFLILVAILAVMILLGMLLLRAFGVSDAGSTSFLAVAILTVVVMVALLDAIYSPWMFLVVPLLSGVAYLLSHWVTTRFDQEAAPRD